MHFLRIKIMVTTICLVTLVSAATGQQNPSEIPDTAAGRILSLLLAALNSGEEAQWKEFIDRHWLPSERPDARERRLGLFSMLYSETGGIDLYRTEESLEHLISILAHAREGEQQGEWLKLTLSVDSVPPNKVTRVSVREGEDPRFDAPEGKLTQDEIVAFLDSYLETLAAEDLFSGTVLIARDGQPFYARAFGTPCKRYDVRNRLDTKFNLGSMNKMFTGVAVMQLVEQGKLSLDEVVGTYLPDIPRQEIADNVTIHHLLSHTSGMQDYWDELFDATWWEIKTVAQMAALIFDDSLLFEPGAEFHYSNSGPILLGLIIEKVSGQDYFDYVREHIYRPAGMINTDCYDMDTPVPNLAIGYTWMDYDGRPLPPGVWHNNLFMHVVKGGPAGGGYSTVEDLLRFDIALRRNTLLTEQSFDLMTTGKVERSPGQAYAYLFDSRTVNGQRIIGHGGGAPGINAALDMYLDSGYTVAVMANYDGAAGKVARKIEDMLTR